MERIQYNPDHVTVDLTRVVNGPMEEPVPPERVWSQFGQPKLTKARGE
jgi:hypothetical protein